jgi:sec-independent protein translocase protein TatA
MGLLGGHGLEFLVVVIVALLVFGPKRLPEMGSAIGKSIKEFKSGMSELANPKENNEDIASKQAATESARLELEAIERELAAKKAALAAQEAAQPEVKATSTSAAE